MLAAANETTLVGSAGRLTGRAWARRYDDMLPFVRRLVEAFGVRRLMWATEDGLPVPAASARADVQPPRPAGPDLRPVRRRPQRSSLARPSLYSLKQSRSTKTAVYILSKLES